MEHKIKKIFFAVILLILILPALQNEFELVTLKPLNGAIVEEIKPVFSKETWLNGEYQAQEEKFYNQHLGLRNFFVRTYNQIYFSFFNHAHANGVIIGKENYLFEENYIKSYLGRDFLGEKLIDAKIEKINKLDSLLKTKDIDLLFVLAPNKASFFEEFIPDSYNPKNKKRTNYAFFKNRLSSSKLNVIDFHQWFRDNKLKSKYPLFSKTGIHWSKYSEILVSDSIIKYVSNLKNVQLPEIKIKKIETSFVMQNTDDDIEQGMNILGNISDNKMAYPQFYLKTNANTKQIKMLSIGDSFFWGIYNYGIAEHVFDKGQFWYYCKEIYPDFFEKKLLIDDVNIITEVEKNKVIMLLSTDANGYSHVFDFVDRLYDAYFNGNTKFSKKHQEEKIQGYIGAIKEDKAWLENIKIQAKNEKITLDAALRKNAEFMVWQEENN